MGEVKFTPENETQTREWFAAHILESKYDLIASQGAFPDYLLGDEDGKEYLVEVEHTSGNFIRHRHDPQECDFVLCWIHDAELTLPVLELSTGVWYEAGEVNESILIKEEKPKSARAVGKVDKERVLEVIGVSAKDEFDTFIECFTRDLRKLNELTDNMVPARTELLRAANALIRILREHGIKIDDLHPYDLFELVRA